VFGGVVSSSFDQEKACELIGTRFEVTRNYFKLHACCRYNHAALDALWQLMGAHSALADITMISAIDVSSYCLAAELVDPAPQNVLAGKFSIPFAIATTLVNRSSKVHSFTSDAVANPTILALARKVTVREDPAMSAKLPDLRPATVTITLANGDVLEASVETNRGDWQDPYTPAQIKEKYLSLTTRIWSDEKAEDVFAAIMNMDNATAPSTFIERL
jgi:2-methylcitrate dehydratase PrpD